MIEKLGGNDPCPCGSGRRFPPLLPHNRPVRRHPQPLLRPRPLRPVCTGRAVTIRSRNADRAADRSSALALSTRGAVRPFRRTDRGHSGR
ncbi:SEC-C metal-binding domain-containing protein [Nonomuraea rosea]|uniref:SEC-C metal-binding domain-containing protein n=1 Tax=Nonomuraea rosea TaxID=638574 RepID=UPI003CD05A0A